MKYVPEMFFTIHMISAAKQRHNLKQMVHIYTKRWRFKHLTWHNYMEYFMFYGNEDVNISCFMVTRI